MSPLVSNFTQADKLNHLREKMLLHLHIVDRENSEIFEIKNSCQEPLNLK